MPFLYQDFETRSAVNLNAAGGSRYARDPSTRVLIHGYAIDGGPIRQWVPVEGERMPSDLHDALEDPDVAKIAFNVNFERLICRFVLGYRIPYAHWTDVMIMARYASVASNLEGVGEIMRLPASVQKRRAKQLMGHFSFPKPDGTFNHWWSNPDWWREYLLYNEKDVASLRAIHRRLRRFMYPEREHAVWVADQRINDRGLPINRTLLEQVVALKDRLIAERSAEVVEITGGIRPTQVAKLLAWCRERGYPFHDMQKGHISAALSSPSGRLQEDCREVLLRRLDVGKASLKKFDALQDRADDDDRLRGVFEFMGAARTSRWSSRGYQAHNMIKAARGLDGLETEKIGPNMVRITGGMQVEMAYRLESDPDGVAAEFRDRIFDVISGAVRTVVQAPEGYRLVVADYKAVENVVLGWLSGDERILRVFDEGLDPYLDFATYLYGERYEDLVEEYESGDKSKRTIAKPAVLGCGFMLGAGGTYIDEETGEKKYYGLLEYARNMGVELTLREAKRCVGIWRQTYRDAVRYWYDLHGRAVMALRHKDCPGTEWDMVPPMLRMELPSGRHLHYLRPRIERTQDPKGRARSEITYEGKLKTGQWGRVGTHPGKVTENRVQAVARDLLADAIVRLESEGVPIVLHTHDEVGALFPEGRAEHGLRRMIKSMETLKPWARGMPITAAGYVSPVYVKD